MIDFCYTGDVKQKSEIQEKNIKSSDLIKREEEVTKLMKWNLNIRSCDEFLNMILPLVTDSYAIKHAAMVLIF